ncbi:sulfatase [Arenibacter sp. ARW7G5Y1]|uniref:sulfatase family protein n=1 Tax=Arenibacter sp. ARW7G5Y1 TaxID=2135619 RepID=UPI000D761D1C|nr:sulfatase [Arenibacter sp. ARW7G5Y1]PXX22828.1 arylsulfatase A-like enzyme [Arenibacter sp. ARW7G5Y1]
MKCIHIVLLIFTYVLSAQTFEVPDVRRPNILFCISDDQSWLHTTAMGDQVINTPAFDKIANEGILFMNAYADAPSCGPSRAAILSGQHIWRLREAGNIHSNFPEDLVNYQSLLEKSGYFTGSYSKAWGPGKIKTNSGWVFTGETKMNPAGYRFNNFKEFNKTRPRDRPFSFWFGSADPHRPYRLNSGKESGMDITAVRVPPVFPDNDIVRNDILDYYYAIQRFDDEVMKVLQMLEDEGILDSTIVVFASDNGMPFPRAKATLYDMGTHVPLAIRWPEKLSSQDKVYDGFITLSDLAPTFLEAANLKIPKDMTGKSLMPILLGKKDENRAYRKSAYTAMERHDGCRSGGKGYPCRAIRTKNFLYIRNYEPDRWPAGDPDLKNCARMIPYGEVAPSPTKTFMMGNESKFPDLFKLTFGMRPNEELYDIREDPFQMNNLAMEEKYKDIKISLSGQLILYTQMTGDPRALGRFAPWDYYPYYGAMPNKNWQVIKE